MKGVRERLERLEGDVRLAPLDLADVRPVQAGSVRQHVLGPAAPQPEPPHGLAQGGVELLHAAKCPGMLPETILVITSACYSAWHARLRRPITARFWPSSAQAKKLARGTWNLTGKPLGVTGEVAEFEAARLLHLELAGAREPGFDAVERGTGRKFQIKGRRLRAGGKRGQRVGSINVEEEMGRGVARDPERGLQP